MKVVHLLLAILGLIALALVIWFVAPLISFAAYSPFEPAWVRWLMIMALFGFFVIRALLRRFRARQNNAQLLEGLVKSSEPTLPTGPSQSAEELATLRQRFEEAMRILKESQAAQAARKGGLARLLALGSSRHLYELPWYVFIGAPGSGKTTALINSGLRFPLADKLGAHQIKGVGGTRNCDWWFTDEAVLIDTAGRYTTQDSNQNVDSDAWSGFLGLLRRHRPKQPLNGVLLTVSIGDLLGFSENQAQHHAETLRARIQELYTQLNTRIPVYVLVTKADLIAGFSEFFADLGKEARDQVWGVTFSPETDAQTIIQNLPDKLAALRLRLEERMIPRLQQESDLSSRGRMLAFDQQLALVDRLLASFLDKVFAPSGFDHPLMARGVYFSSGTQEGSPIDRVMTSLGGAFGLDHYVLPPQAGSGKSFFITRLLREVVFAEQRIGGTNLKWERRRSLFRLAVVAGLGLLALGLLLAWGLSYSRNASYIDEVNARINAIQPIVANARMASSDDLLGIIPVIDAISGVTRTSARADGIPLAMRYGLYQGSKLDAATDQAYHTLLREVLLPRITNRIEYQLKNLDPNNPEYAYEGLKAYVMLFDNTHFEAETLKAWVSFDWEQSLPGSTTPEQRDSLARHLATLFENGTVVSSIPMNQELVASVRAQLLRYPLPDRILSRLKREGVGGDIPEFTVEHAVGPSAITVFARKSGKSLSKGVPGLYTYEGYHKGFDKSVEAVAKHLIEEEPWVLGLASEPRRPDEQQKIIMEVRRLYLNDYVRTWDNFIADVTIARSSNLQQSIQIARVLSAGDSPLARLMRAIARETTLGKSTAMPETIGKAQDAINETKSELGKLLFGATTSAQTAAPGTSIESIVDDHFSQQRALVSGDEKTAPINTTIQLLNDIYVFLSAVETAQRDKLSLPQSEVPNRAKAESARMPEPLRTMLQQLSAAGTGQALSNLRETLSSAVGAQIGQYCIQAIGGRYPFVRNSPRDVGRDDFATLFGPGGKMDEFFNKNLAQYVDMSTKPWSFKKVQEQSIGDPGNLLQFERAATIREVFFRSSGPMRLDFKPVEMDPAITNFTLDVDGQLIKYSHGPQVPQSVQWPGPKGGVQVRVQINPPGPSGVSGAAVDGPWALFRMLDKANIQPGGSPERFRVGFSIDGRTAVFDVTTSSVQNPFRLRELMEFRCPGVL